MPLAHSPPPLPQPPHPVGGHPRGGFGVDVVGSAARSCGTLTPSSSSVAARAARPESPSSSALALAPVAAFPATAVAAAKTAGGGGLSGCVLFYSVPDSVVISSIVTRIMLLL